MAIDGLMQVPRNRGVVKNDKKTSFGAIIDHSMNQHSLKNTTSIDVGRQTWIKYNWKLTLSFIEWVVQ